VFKSVARELPLIVSFAGEVLERDLSKELREAGVLAAADPALTMGALSFLNRRQRMQALPKLQERQPLPECPGPRNWAQIMRFCDDSGITPAKWVVLHPEAQAAHACAGMTYPLVVKVLPWTSDRSSRSALAA
jgi:hypothetical protein